MRYARTQPTEKLNYYELALMLAQERVVSPTEEWPEFIDQLSRICDAFARARYQSSRTGIYIEPHRSDRIA